VKGADLEVVAAARVEEVRKVAEGVKAAAEVRRVVVAEVRAVAVVVVQVVRAAVVAAVRVAAVRKAGAAEVRVVAGVAGVGAAAKAAAGIVSSGNTRRFYFNGASLSQESGASFSYFLSAHLDVNSAPPRSFIPRVQRGILVAGFFSPPPDRHLLTRLSWNSAGRANAEGFRMTAKRGREGRLKQEHAALYPGLKAGTWLPVETLIRHVTDLIHRDRSRAEAITGPRLLHQEHFEFRGRSARPEGIPPESSRLSDSGADPGSAASA
jgi:hypothetical protein